MVLPLEGRNQPLQAAAGVAEEQLYVPDRLNSALVNPVSGPGEALQGAVPGVTHRSDNGPQAAQGRKDERENKKVSHKPRLSAGKLVR